MKKINIGNVTKEGALYVAQRIRESDLQEIMATRFDGETAEDIANSACYLKEMSWEFQYDGVPVAIMGIRPLWPSVWYVWMYATDDYQKVILAMTKWAKRVIMPMLWKDGARRVETRSISTHTTAHKWLEFMGARVESVLESYGKNGEDFFVFKWVRHPSLTPENMFRRRRVV